MVSQTGKTTGVATSDLLLDAESSSLWNIFSKRKHKKANIINNLLRFISGSFIFDNFFVFEASYSHNFEVQSSVFTSNWGKKEKNEFLNMAFGKARKQSEFIDLV